MEPPFSLSLSPFFLLILLVIVNSSEELNTNEIPYFPCSFRVIIGEIKHANTEKRHGYVTALAVESGYR